MSDLRKRLYNDVAVQLLLTGFLRNETSALKPALDADKTPRYVIVENVTRLSPNEAIALLDSMADASLLSKELSAKVICCPTCDSASKVSERFECPRCGSIDISALRFSHKSKQESTARGDERKGIVEGRDKDNVGSGCRCNDCGSEFIEPSLLFICEKCNLRFRFHDAKLRDLFSFQLNEAILDEIRHGAFLLRIGERLMNRDFRIQIPGVLGGLSGASHYFTLIGKKGEATIVIDVLQSKEPSGIGELDLLSFYAKLIDVEVTDAMIVAIPRIADKGRSLAEAMQIKYVEVANPGEALPDLEKALSSSHP